MVIGGTILLFAGLEHFVGKRGTQIHNVVLLVIFASVHTWFTIIHPSLDARNIIFSLGILAICSQCAWLLLRRVDADMLPITRHTGIIFAAYGLASVIRIYVDLVMPNDENFFHSSVYDTFLVMMYQMLFIALTFSLSLAVNRRLVASLESDIVERKQAGLALTLSEEKFFKAFNSSPDAIIITRVRDGQVLEVNEGFTRMTGYSQQEALSNSVITLGFWTTPQERDMLLAELHVSQRVHGIEYDFRVKSGRILHCLYSGEIIHLNGETHILSVIRDITEQKRIEQDLRIRNNVQATLHQVTLDLINRHDVNDILQSFLIQISGFLDAADISVDLLEDSDTLVTSAVTSGQPLQAGDTMRRGEGGWLSWQAIDSGQPAVLEDYSKWEKRRELYEGYPIHAIMIIPIHSRSHVIGTINISRREENAPFDGMNIDAAQQLAQMVALVLDNAKLYSQLQSELTERRRVENELRVLSRTVEQSQSAVIITDTNGAIEYVNPKFTELTDYSLQEVLGKNPRILRPDDVPPEVYEEMWKTILAGGEWRGELLSRKKNGEVFWDETIISPIVNEGGAITHFVSMKEDITKHKQAQEALLRLAAFEERQRMARDLHDSVNQSIHSLVLFSETLVAALEKNNIDRARQVSERLQESARQALKEMRLLLYQTRPSVMEKGMSFIEELKARLANVELRAGGKANVILEGSLEHCPEAWQENLFWIAIEALNNSLKHAQARKVEIIIRCFPEYMELEVKDNGRGLIQPNRTLGVMVYATCRNGQICLAVR
jgi:PAS domain S-box-containing protein